MKQVDLHNATEYLLERIPTKMVNEVSGEKDAQEYHCAKIFFTDFRWYQYQSKQRSFSHICINGKCLWNVPYMSKISIYAY